MFFGLSPIQAQIVVIPLQHDFGEVNVGENASSSFSIMNTGWETYHIERIILATGSGPDFSLTDPCSPCLLSPGEVIDIGVVFTPSVYGLATAGIVIEWTNGMCGTEFVNLSGTGVSAPIPPVSIEGILSFFDGSVADGSLTGSGPGYSAENRLNALRNMLLAVNHLIDEGNYITACMQLSDAYKHCDGQDAPPDFVQGISRDELAQMILDLMEALGCT